MFRHCCPKLAVTAVSELDVRWPRVAAPLDMLNAYSIKIQLGLIDLVIAPRT